MPPVKPPATPSRSSAVPTGAAATSVLQTTRLSPSSPARDDLREMARELSRDERCEPVRRDGLREEWRSEVGVPCWTGLGERGE
eukprot:4258918-Prymnesium_polylepis.1